MGAPAHGRMGIWVWHYEAELSSKARHPSFYKQEAGTLNGAGTLRLYGVSVMYSLSTCFSPPYPVPDPLHVMQGSHLPLCWVVLLKKD